MLRILTVFLVSVISSTAIYAGKLEINLVKEHLAKTLPPGVSIDAVRPSVVSGFYEVEVGAQIIYVTEDGKYLFLGDVVDLKTRANLSETWRQQSALKLIDNVGEKNMIVMGPKKAKRTITVFTDVDCPYCAKLHTDVPALTQQGVKVRYLLFPRGGVNSETYRRSVAVWCAADRVKAVGVAKAGGKLDMKTCDNPVTTHYQLGRNLGIDGTPTIYLDDGQKLGGYIPSDRLLAILGLTTLREEPHAAR